MPQSNNPCLTCPDICCALKGDCGLRLAATEFESHFRAYEDSLNVRVENDIVVLSTKEGLVCPNLGEKGCRIYAARPIDCRLYPYQVLPLYQTRRRAKFLLVVQPRCASESTFAFPESEAAALVEEFGRKVCGDKQIVVQIFVDRFLPKLRSKCEVLAVNLCKTLGIPL